jgi:phosphogluconate dehydratase
MKPMKLHATVDAVTQRIRERSAASRAAYLQRLDATAHRPPGAERMGCANVAHAFAAMPDGDKAAALPARNTRIPVVAQRAPNIGHRQRLQRHACRPTRRCSITPTDQDRGAPPRRHGPGGRRRAGHVRRRHAGHARHGAEPVQPRRDRHGHGRRAVPRHVRRRADAGRVRQDRAGPADRCAAFRPPAHGVRAGRPHDLGPVEQRQGQGARAGAQGLVGRDELLQAESQAYHGPGTCTFYGTANSNQMLLEAMGLHVPGTAFVNPRARRCARS